MNTREIIGNYILDLKGESMKTLLISALFAVSVVTSAQDTASNLGATVQSALTKYPAVLVCTEGVYPCVGGPWLAVTQKEKQESEQSVVERFEATTGLKVVHSIDNETRIGRTTTSF